MKRRLPIIIVLATSCAGEFCLAGCGPAAAPAKPCDIPGTVHEQAVPAKTAPGGGEIRVVEQGFDQGDALSVGAILRNTSNRIAYRTRIEFVPTIVSHGKQAQSRTGFLSTEIPVLLPGAEVGVGREISFSGQKVTAVALDVRTTTWLPENALSRGFTTSTTRYDRSVHPLASRPDAVDIHYTERSTTCRPLVNRGAAIIFRNAGGKIVGGALAVPDRTLVFRDGGGNEVDLEQRPPPTPSCAPGQRETWVAPQTGAPAAADDRRTAVYSYCDVNAPPNDPNTQP